MDGKPSCTRSTHDTDENEIMRWGVVKTYTPTYSELRGWHSVFAWSVTPYITAYLTNLPSLASPLVIRRLLSPIESSWEIPEPCELTLHPRGEWRRAGGIRGEMCPAASYSLGGAAQWRYWLDS